MVAATPLPVTGDLENGFADDPEGVADTVRLAGDVGLSGGSIEDISGGVAYGFDLAVDRVGFQHAFEAHQQRSRAGAKERFTSPR